MMINIKLNIDKNKKGNLLPQTNNFFLENTHIAHKKKSPNKQPNSFRDLTKQQFTDFSEDKELLLTDREKKKPHKQGTHHKRTNSTTKKNNNHQHASTRHPTPSTGASSKFNSTATTNQQFSSNNNSQLNAVQFGNFQKNKQKDSNKKTVNKDKQINISKQGITKNISELMFKLPKKKMMMGNNSSLGDEESLKGSIPGWSGQKVIQRFGLLLTEYQKQELVGWKQVYYIGVGTGVGEDNQDGTYAWRKHQQLGFRYELLQPLGSGAFGEVIKAFDHKTKQYIAVKIIRSKKQHMQLALNEINILMKAKQKDIENEKNILRIKDFIVFKKHICIITELLSISLYELLEANNFTPLQMTYIRTFAIQILNALAYLKEIKVVHSDLKPQNVMLKNKLKTGIKIIDFGTSMFSNETNFLYIQSRFYRAPQIILGAPYGYQIDMWSFGCLLAELYLGQPIFPGKDEAQQLALIMECVGVPQNEQFLKKCKHYDQYFSSYNTPKPYKNDQQKLIKPNSRQLFLMIQDKSFCQYLSKILVIHPKSRYTPLQALLDPWILEGLPQQIKQQHLTFIKSKMKDEKKKAQKQFETKGTKKIATEKKGHRRQNTTQVKQQVLKHQSARKQDQAPQQTAKKPSRHTRRNSDINKYQDFNARSAHLRHKRRGSAGFC